MVYSFWDSKSCSSAMQHSLLDFPGGTSGKEPACQCRRCKRPRFYPWVGKIPWRRKWQPTLVFLPEKVHGKQNLAGYSPWSRKESDTTKQQQKHSLLIIGACLQKKSTDPASSWSPSKCNYSIVESLIPSILLLNPFESLFNYPFYVQMSEWRERECDSHSVVSDSLQPHAL